MDLCISIVNYNTCELLDRCLESIFEFPPAGEFEVVVVDNASVDDSVAMVAEKYPQVRLIASEENLGYAGGNNAALHDSRARYDLILNSDIEVEDGALTRLCEFMDNTPEAGMAGARLILPDGSIQPSCATTLSLRKFATQQLLLDRAGLAGLTFGEYWIDVASVTEPIQVEQLTGACMCCRREAVDEVGMMDEAYWMYAEDSDYCVRFEEHGWKLYYVPDARMLHVLGGSSRSARAEMIAAYNHSVARYFRVHGSRMDAAGARALGIIGAWLRLTGWLVPTILTLGLVPGFRRKVALFAHTLWLSLRAPRPR